MTDQKTMDMNGRRKGDTAMSNPMATQISQQMSNLFNEVGSLVQSRAEYNLVQNFVALAAKTAGPPLLSAATTLTSPRGPVASTFGFARDAIQDQAAYFLAEASKAPAVTAGAAKMLDDALVRVQEEAAKQRDWLRSNASPNIVRRNWKWATDPHHVRVGTDDLQTKFQRLNQRTCGAAKECAEAKGILGGTHSLLAYVAGISPRHREVFSIPDKDAKVTPSSLSFWESRDLYLDEIERWLASIAEIRNQLRAATADGNTRWFDVVDSVNDAWMLFAQILGTTLKFSRELNHEDGVPIVEANPSP